MKTSIALCTYNGQKYLQQQLDSIASQSRLPHELVIVDDVSTDSTWSIIEEFQKSASFTVKIVRNSVNLGAIRNFESALTQCTGEVIFLSDQDDIWRQDKLEHVARLFEESPKLELVFSDAVLVDTDLNELPTPLWNHMGFSGNSVTRFKRDPFEFLLTDHNVVTGAAAAFSRRAVHLALPFPETLAVFHDGWLALVASAIGPVTASPIPLLSYRQHDEQQLGVRQLNPDFGLSDYERHLRQLTELRKRLDQILSLKHRHLLDQQILHLKTRTTLSPNALQRGFQILSELSSGRYSRFSSGIKSAGKDYLRRGQ